MATRSLGKAAAAAKGSRGRSPESRAGKGWYSSGWGSANASIAKREQEFAETKTGIARMLFWLKPGGEGKIIMVDGQPFMCRVHEIVPNGDYKKKTIKVCLTLLGLECPYCAADIKMDEVGCFTVINCAKWTDRQNKEHQYTLQIMMNKLQTLKLLSKMAEKKGDDLTGVLFEVLRSGEKSPRTGDSFVPSPKTVNLKDPAIWKKMNMKAAPKAFDYEAIFEPQTVKDAQDYLNALAGSTAPPSSAPAAKSTRGKKKTDEDDDVPF